MARRGAVEAVAAGCGLSQLRVRHGVDLLAAQHTPVELLQSQHRGDREGRFAAVARDHADLAGEQNNGNARPINMYCEGLLQGVPTARGLGWVDLNLERSTVCPILPELMGIWQKRLGQMVKHPNQSQPIPTQVHEHLGHLVVIIHHCNHQATVETAYEVNFYKVKSLIK